MNNQNPVREGKIRGKFFTGKLKDVCILGGLAIVLMIAVWKIFYNAETAAQSTAYTASEKETKIAKLLEKIEGVGDADVIICETEEGVSGVVVVCEGAQDFYVVMRVREAVAAALGTDEKTVKIYLKKE